jgi:hypothetical protein
MYPGDADDVRSWTARHGSALHALISAHARFMESASAAAARGTAPGSPAAAHEVEAAADHLLEAARVAGTLPPVPDPQAQELLAQFLSSVPAIVAAPSEDLATLRTRLLRSSLAMVELMDRLLPLM